MTLTIEHIKAMARLAKTGVTAYQPDAIETLCALAIKVIAPPPPGQYDELCRRLRIAEEVRLRHASTANFEMSEGCYTEAAAAITDLQQQVRDARGKAIEEAAAIIRKYAVTESENGPSLRERYDGDIHATHYATAILALKDK